MKTLLAVECAEEIGRRIASLTPNDARQWGIMSPQEMVCHLGDSFDVGLGHRTAGPIKSPVPVPVMKWLALRLPMKWPKNTPTTPEVQQGVGGRTPTEWETDVQLLLESFQAFCAKREGWPEHPIFREMSTAEWMRWGYLHADHHLRQFSR